MGVFRRKKVQLQRWESILKLFEKKCNCQGGRRSGARVRSRTSFLAAVAIWWNRFYQRNFNTQHTDQISFDKVSSSLDNFQYIVTPSERNYQRLPVLRSRVKCSRPSFPPICKLHWHTHTPLHLKHLKSSVCAVRVNSLCTFFAWFINFGNIYVQLFGKRNLKYAATQARVVKQLPPGILTRGPRITDLSDQGDHNWSKQSKWSAQIGDHPIKVIRAAWWSGWTHRRRASSCASSPPAQTFQSLKTFAKNFSFPQSLRPAGTTTMRALKPAVTAAMTQGKTSLRMMRRVILVTLSLHSFASRCCMYVFCNYIQVFACFHPYIVWRKKHSLLFGFDW